MSKSATANVHVEGRVSGAALKTLSKDQIHALVMLAREAWQQEFPPSDLDFDVWRHRQVMATVERGGLTQCRNEDFLFLKAHFLKLLGRDAEAGAALARHELEPRTWAWHKFQEAVREAKDAAAAAGDKRFDPIAYAGGFLRRKRGVNLDDADTKSIWQAYYLLRRKAGIYGKRDEGGNLKPETRNPSTPLRASLTPNIEALA